MLLQELFKQKKVEVKVVHSSKSEFTAETYLQNGKELTVDGSRFESDYEDEYWSLDFSVEGRYTLTKDGNEIEVFSTVASILRSFIEAKDASMITTTADEANRAKLYTRLYKRELKGWKVAQISTNNYFTINAVKGAMFPVYPHYEEDGVYVIVFGNIEMWFDKDGETVDNKYSKNFYNKLSDDEKSQFTDEINKIKKLGKTNAA